MTGAGEGKEKKGTGQEAHEARAHVPASPTRPCPTRLPRGGVCRGDETAAWGAEARRLQPPVLTRPPPPRHASNCHVARLADVAQLLPTIVLFLIFPARF